MLLIQKHDFFSDAALTALRNGNYHVRRYADERNGQNPFARREEWDVTCQPAAAELMRWIESMDVRNKAVEEPDLAWRWVCNRALYDVDVSISKYEPREGFTWHVDHVGIDAARALNWMCTLDGFAKLEWTTEHFPVDMGGQNDAVRLDTYEPDQAQVHETQLLPNSIVLFPSWYPHRVISGDVPRVSAHGHFLYNDSQLDI